MNVGRADLLTGGLRGFVHLSPKYVEVNDGMHARRSEEDHLLHFPLH